MIQLTLLHSQEWTTFATYELWRKPNTTSTISVDPTKIITVHKREPKKDSLSYRRDYPTFTEITLVGRNHIHVIETPEKIESLIRQS